MTDVPTRPPVRTARVVALVVGILLALPSLGMLLGGTAIVLAHAFGRDDDGYFTADLDRIASATPAITAEEVDLSTRQGVPRRLIRAADATVRFRVTPADEGGEIFV